MALRPDCATFGANGRAPRRIAETRWTDVDFDRKIWTISPERSKNKQAHEIPLSDEAVRIIETLPRIGGRDGYIFTTTGRTPVSGWSRAKDRIDRAILEILREEAKERGENPDAVIAPAGWVFHDFRRTAASGMAGIGIPPHVVEAVLNHRSGTIKGVAAVYSRYSYAAEKRQALDAWACKLEAIVSGRRRATSSSSRR